MKTKTRGPCNYSNKKWWGVQEKKLAGGGGKLTDQDLEEKGLSWIHERRENMLRLSRKFIMKKTFI